MLKDRPLIRKIYLYLFSFVGLLLIVIGLVRLVDLGLKVYIFKKADTFVFYPTTPSRLDKNGNTVDITEEEKAKFQKEQEATQFQQTESNRQRTASNSIAMILIGAPLFFYHWRTIGKENS
ncbi:hypothetical protein HY404_02135 [Candidatus Microgenomates bacterium]|nr:hypothetical protein [Candidatus Microgenomates bacterium]